VDVNAWWNSLGEQDRACADDTPLGWEQAGVMRVQIDPLPALRETMDATVARHVPETASADPN
jgi:hypothetical protein